MRKRHRFLLVIVPLSVATILLLSFRRKPETTQAVGPASSVPAVQFVAAERHLVTDSLDLVAKVQPDPTKVVHIYPPASGRVLEILVKPGDHVRARQTLAMIQSSDVAGARADYDKAKVEADRARRAMEREKQLLDHGAAAEKDYLDAQAASASAQAELARAEQRLRLLNAGAADNSGVVPMGSPTEGVVLDVAAAPGEFAKSLDSANPLITVADLNPIWVVGDVYEKDVAKLRVGLPVQVKLAAYPGRQWSGRIAAVSDALDPTTRTLKLRVVLPNPGRQLKPEMFATIHAETGQHEALLVPTTAVIREGNLASVYVQDTRGKVEQRQVSAGRNLDGFVEITAGLHAGEKVAGTGVELLRGGASD